MTTYDASSVDPLSEFCKTKNIPCGPIGIHPEILNLQLRAAQREGRDVGLLSLLNRIETCQLDEDVFLAWLEIGRRKGYFHEN